MSHFLSHLVMRHTNTASSSSSGLALIKPRVGSRYEAPSGIDASHLGSVQIEETTPLAHSESSQSHVSQPELGRPEISQPERKRPTVSRADNAESHRQENIRPQEPPKAQNEEKPSVKPGHMSEEIIAPNLQRPNDIKGGGVPLFESDEATVPVMAKRESHAPSFSVNNNVTPNVNLKRSASQDTRIKPPTQTWSDVANTSIPDITRERASSRPATPPPPIMENPRPAFDSAGVGESELKSGFSEVHENKPSVVREPTHVGKSSSSVNQRRRVNETRIDMVPEHIQAETKQIEPAVSIPDPLSSTNTPSRREIKATDPNRVGTKAKSEIKPAKPRLSNRASSNELDAISDVGGALRGRVLDESELLSNDIAVDDSLNKTAKNFVAEDASDELTSALPRLLSNVDTSKSDMSTIRPDISTLRVFDNESLDNDQRPLSLNIIDSENRSTKPSSLESPQPPVIKVSIGQIEIRSSTPPPQTVNTSTYPPRTRGPAVSLSDYLNSRGGRK